MSRSNMVALLCTALIFSTAVSAFGGAKLLVVSQDESILQVFDPDSGKLLGGVRTGRGPHEVIATPDGRYAFVGDFESVDNTVTKIDLHEYERVQAIKLDPFYGPHDLAITRDGKRLFVTAEKTRTIIEIDPETGELLMNYNTLSLMTHKLVLSPDEEFIFATNNAHNNLSVIDLVRGEHERYIRCGKGAEALDITPDGKFLWVANRIGQSISILDVAERKNIETVPCPGYPMRLRITPDGKQALVTMGTRGVLAVIDVASREEVGAVETGELPLGLAIQPDGKRAFVSNAKDNTVSVIDLGALEVLRVLKTAKAPDGLAYVAK
jgi:YVTN family beta-propeller protein